MKIMGIVGYKNSGKTRLMQEIIKYFATKNILVSTIKHAHHNFAIDQDGTDSFIHRNAGAVEVLISSSKRWAKIDERKNLKELTLSDLLKKIDRADIVLVEGFKNENHKKIEVVRKIDRNQKPLYNSLTNIVAVVTNQEIDIDLPKFKDNEFKKIGEFILSECQWTKNHLKKKK